MATGLIHCSPPPQNFWIWDPPLPADQTVVQKYCKLVKIS